MAAAQRAAATNGPDPDPDPGPDPGTGAGFCQSTVSIFDNHVLDNHVWRLWIVVVEENPPPCPRNEARSGRVWSPSEASSTMSTSNDQRFQRSTINVVDDGLVNDQY